IWRKYTIPAKGEPGSETWGNYVEYGGGATWLSGTYDPQLNTLYWATGNAWPDFYGGDRAGDNLYSCSLLALDADTGKMKWYFQFTPHDTHDWDAQAWPVLVDLPYNGKMRKLVLHLAVVREIHQHGPCLRIPIVRVMRGELKIPLHLPGVRVERQQRAGIQVVSSPVAAVKI